MRSNVHACWHGMRCKYMGFGYTCSEFVRAVMMCRGEHGPRGRLVAEAAAGVHAVATEEAAMLVEDVVMPDRGEVQEQARAAVVMVAVVGTGALEVLAAAE